MAKSSIYPKPIFIGVEDGFTGFRYIETRLKQEDFPNVRIINNLDDAIIWTLFMTHLEEEIEKLCKNK